MFFDFEHLFLSLSNKLGTGGSAAAATEGSTAGSFESVGEGGTATTTRTTYTSEGTIGTSGTGTGSAGTTTTTGTSGTTSLSDTVAGITEKNRKKFLRRGRKRRFHPHSRVD